uniref:Hpr(Ser) kinase/phosphatase n=1 Tax=Magnetococcus massalia (strain MO-1) TaxID=451514 RepID=A0A1S7LN55_MAGMO|nr:Conserved protein of unknown function [Candidatus Magnetococcus massalia]
MRLRDLSAKQLEQRLRGDGLRWRTGPALFNLQSDVAQVGPWLQRFYGAAPVEQAGEHLTTCHVGVLRERGLRRWVRPQVRIWVDGPAPFIPFALDHTPPNLEWGLNFLISTRLLNFFILHAAALERDGGVLLMPGVPGSGKSTLAAALSQQGWRLLSDEFGIIAPHTKQAIPIPKSIALKNASIDALAALYPNAPMGPRFPNTRKGTVAHLPCGDEALEKMAQRAEVRWIIFPRFEQGQGMQLESVMPDRLFPRLAGGAFNYESLGAAAFQTVATLAESVPAYAMHYGDMAQALATIAQITTTAQITAGEQP